MRQRPPSVSSSDAFAVLHEPLFLGKMAACPSSGKVEQQQQQQRGARRFVFIASRCVAGGSSSDANQPATPPPPPQTPRNTKHAACVVIYVILSCSDVKRGVAPVSFPPGISGFERPTEISLSRRGVFVRCASPSLPLSAGRAAVPLRGGRTAIHGAQSPLLLQLRRLSSGSKPARSNSLCSLVEAPMRTRSF